MDPSSPSMMTRTVDLPIPMAEVGLFVGENDSSLMKFVITKSQRTYVREHGSAGDDMPFVKVSVVVTGDFGSQELSAECEAPNESLLDIIEENLNKHSTNFKRERKPKIVRLVFMSHMDPQLIGKYIGSSGNNIKTLASQLEQDAVSSGLEAKSFRVRIEEEGNDPYKENPKRYFEIKNGSESRDTVFIFVTAQFSGPLRPLFLCIKERMISSVVDCIESSKQTHRRDMEDYDDLYAPEPTDGEDSYA